jgi:hypothetical protein
MLPSFITKKASGSATFKIAAPSPVRKKSKNQGRQTISLQLMEVEDQDASTSTP